MTRKEEIKLMIRKVVSSHLSGDYDLFIFGSQAGLSELKRADIDVGIEAARQLTLYEESIIWNELEDLPTLYNFDLVDFKKTEESFKKIALQNIEKL